MVMETYKYDFAARESPLLHLSNVGKYNGVFFLSRGRALFVRIYLESRPHIVVGCSKKKRKNASGLDIAPLERALFTEELAVMSLLMIMQKK